MQNDDESLTRLLPPSMRELQSVDGKLRCAELGVTRRRAAWRSRILYEACLVRHHAVRNVREKDRARLAAIRRCPQPTHNVFRMRCHCADAVTNTATHPWGSTSVIVQQDCFHNMPNITPTVNKRRWTVAGKRSSAIPSRTLRSRSISHRVKMLERENQRLCHRVLQSQPPQPSRDWDAGEPQRRWS
ncbi:hypothetical protein PR003_g13900 [Phytophthora rubi]|uniref:Uncharacterized protein n=1 Tax=Phytophthora rubi TaxID=129364 RepID=A0A6A4F5H9_9STRA|nr:hypothetical protein PR001_g2662 [Phytophthora rubi]KAE9333690.1 hypothetical protein PR003_g13900 [Phytophthora rubi]